jgi:hypothetical protein
MPTASTQIRTASNTSSSETSQHQSSSGTESHGGSNQDGQNSQTPRGNERDGPDGSGANGSGNGGPAATTTSNLPNEEGKEQYEMFSGKATVQLPGSIEQELYISFDLQISPSERRGRDVDCKIALDRVVVGASSMEDRGEDEMDVDLDHYFIVKECRISVGPLDGDCSAPHSVAPRERSFIDKYTKQRNWQAGITMAASQTPGVTPTVSYGQSKQTEQPSVVVEIEGFNCGGGPRQSYRWRYRPKSQSAKTHMEFSSTNPPTHTVSFTVPRIQNNPKALRIRAKAIYERKGPFRRVASGMLAKLGFKQDVQLRHFAMELEAKIGTEVDYCRFPVDQLKGGAYLVMKVDARSGTVEPDDETSPFVSAILNTPP